MDSGGYRGRHAAAGGQVTAAEAGRNRWEPNYGRAGEGRWRNRLSRADQTRPGQARPGECVSETGLGKAWPRPKRAIRGRWAPEAVNASQSGNSALLDAVLCFDVPCVCLSACSAAILGVLMRRMAAFFLSVDADCAIVSLFEASLDMNSQRLMPWHKGPGWRSPLSRCPFNL
jgi:hypothetical protein